MPDVWEPLNLTGAKPKLSQVKLAQRKEIASLTWILSVFKANYSESL